MSPSPIFTGLYEVVGLAPAVVDAPARVPTLALSMASAELVPPTSQDARRSTAGRRQHAVPQAPRPAHDPYPHKIPEDLQQVIQLLPVGT